MLIVLHLYYIMSANNKNLNKIQKRSKIGWILVLLQNVSVMYTENIKNTTKNNKIWKARSKKIELVVNKTKKTTGDLIKKSDEKSLLKKINCWDKIRSNGVFFTRTMSANNL